MKAVVQDGYGAPRDVLRVTDVPKPQMGDDDVLIRVHAASVNALDWRRVRASPVVVRGEGLRRPKRPVLGVDVAGRVAEVGRSVTHVRPGDEVFGIGRGSFADYVSGRTIVLKPRNLTLEQAGAVPVAGLTAFQALQHKGRVEAGQRVAITGAGGGVGTFAVQIAKALGAEVTAVTTTRNSKLVRAIGADHVVAYDAEDFTDSGPFDLVIDVGADRPISACLRALTPTGTLVLVGAGRRFGGPVGRMAAGSLRQRLMRQPVVAFVSWESAEDLHSLKDLIEARDITPVIDTTYRLEDTADAVHYLETGCAQGKVIIAV